jgi:peptidyl-prolyl cis-trans isomerase D
VGQQYVPLLEAQYRSQLLQAKLARHLVASVYVSDSELWERFRDQRETVKIGAVMVDPAIAVPDSEATVTPSEIQQYYAARRDSLERQPTAFISYLELDRRPIQSDTAAALARAQALRAEIAGGVPFAEVARRESSDTVSGNRGGDLGEWAKGSFDADFEKVAFSIPLNTVSEPVLTRFGYHVIEVSKRQDDKATGRHILIPVEVTGEHRDQLDARADSLENLAAERLDPAALDTASRVLGLPVRPVGAIVKSQPSAAPPDAAVWAFQAKVGEQSPVVETPGSYLIFRLDSLHPGGVPTLDDARAQIEARLRFEKKKAAARNAAGALAARARTDGLAAIAGAQGGRYETLGPFNRINSPLQGGNATGVAFGMIVGDVSAAEGRDVVYVLQVLERTAADSAAFTTELPSLRESALQNARALYLRQYMTALRDKAEIVDNRNLIFKTAAQIEAEAPVLPGTLP